MAGPIDTITDEALQTFRTFYQHCVNARKRQLNRRYWRFDAILAGYKAEVAACDTMAKRRRKESAR